MEGAALAGAGQRDRPRKGGKRTKASKAQELFEEEVKRLVKLIDLPGGLWATGIQVCLRSLLVCGGGLFCGCSGPVSR